jgi:cytochrome c oxidase cbb3-type subunit 2
MKFDFRSRFQPLLAVALMAGWFAGVLGSGFSTASAENSPQPPEENSGAGKNESAYAEIAKAPEKERAKRNPFENDPDAITAGNKLFTQHCAECHGNMVEGGKKAPSLRDKEVQDAPPGALFWVLTNGVVRRGMPVWSKLPEPQRWQIVSFLKSLRED